MVDAPELMVRYSSCMGWTAITIQELQFDFKGFNKNDFGERDPFISPALVVCTDECSINAPWQHQRGD